jgi:hypothetical protein
LNWETIMIKLETIVTGATGRTGSIVVGEPLKAACPVRAIGHRKDQRSACLKALRAPLAHTVMSGVRPLALCILGLLGVTGSSRPTFSADAAPPPTAVSARDGSHDFDFNIGVWNTHITRILDPLDGGQHRITLEGTVTVCKVWDGRAQLEEIEADGPNGHWEGLTLFLYNPTAHQWNQTFANSKNGTLTTPMIGAFKEGRGELIAQDSLDGRSVLVRGVWSDITADGHHFEEDYSSDGGRTWSPAFITTLTRKR